MKTVMNLIKKYSNKIFLLAPVIILAFFATFIIAPQSASAAFTINKTPRITNLDTDANLVGWWTFDGKDCGATYCLDKNPGATKSLGTLTSVMKSTGKVGQGLSFDGANSFMDIGNAPTPLQSLPTGGYSICAWINPRSMGEGSLGTIFDSYFSLSGGVALLLRTAGANTNSLQLSTSYSGSSGLAISVDNVIDFNKWQHVCGVLNSSTKKGIFYKNSLLLGLQTDTAGDGTVPSGSGLNVRIGNHSDATDRTFDGAIDDVRVYSRALSAAEISRLYNQGAQKQAVTMNRTPAKTTLENDANLVGWWPFNFADITGSWALDKSSSLNKATTTGVIKSAGKLGQALSFNVSTPAPTTSGLVGWWNMDTSQINGTAITDLSGGGHTGTLIGTTKVGGKIGQARSFNGTTDYINVGAIDIGSSFSVSAWINPTETGKIIIADRAAHTGEQFNFLMATGNKLFLFVQDTSVTAADTFTLSAWNHVAVTYSSQSVRFYVNGVADSGNPQALAANPVYDGTNFWIGAQNINPSPNSPFIGSLDDVRVYNRALSASEIAVLAANPPGLVVSPVASLNSFTAMSVGTWVKYASSTGSQILIQKADTSTSSSAYILKSNGTNFQLTIGTTTPITITGTTAIANNKWYHVMGTADGTNMRLYVNGNQEASASESGTINTMLNSKSDYTSSLFFGSDDKPANFLVGWLDDPRIYSRALSVNEIMTLYKQGNNQVTMNTTPTKTTLENDTSLVGWWTMDGKDIYGSTVLDKNPSATKYNGTLTGTSKVTGKLGQALSLNGTSDYINESAAASTYKAYTANTVSFWMKPYTSAGMAPFCFGTGTAADDSFWCMYYGGNVAKHIGLFTRKSGSFQVQVETVGTYDPNQWLHFVVTGGSTGNKIYVNGQRPALSYVTGGEATDASFSTPSTANFTELDMGKRFYNNGSGSYFNGQLDDVRVYNRVLSATEVYQLYRRGI